MGKIYGKFLIGNVAIPTQRADHILGAQIQERLAAPKAVTIQWQNASDPQQLTMELPQAMFLLSVLRAIQLDEKVKMPNDTRIKGNQP